MSTPNPTQEQFMTPGWYIDPADPQVKRRWDGYAWTQDTVPAPRPAKTHALASEAIRGFWERNIISLIALVVCVLYLIIDNYTNSVVFGLIPISLSIQAFRRREPLWVAAAIVTAVTVAAPFVLLNH